MMKVLLRHGAIVDDGKDMGKSALHHPAMEDDPDAVDLLLEAGASIPNEDGNPTYSPVSSAAVRLAYGMALSLLEHGSKVNVDEHDGETPLALVLSMAQAPGCAKMVDLSLRWGADETDTSVADVMSKSDFHDWEGDVRRVKKLLANVPADRAWRCRGLPILCRAFPDRCLPEREPEGSCREKQAAWMVPGATGRKRHKLEYQWSFDPPGTGTTDLVPGFAGDTQGGDRGDG
ncbi:unnamed protein product, partial [Pylaiella littoralis]